MEVQVESPGGLVRRMHVRVDAGRVDSAFDARLKQVAARARIPGFRPGKVPMKVLVKQYGDSARAEAIRELVGETYPQALSQAKVTPAGMPRFEVVEEKPGEALSYVASFEVLPEIHLADLNALAIKQPAVDVSESDVDHLIENLRKGRRSWTVVTRAAQIGDQVVVDFNGTLDGLDFQGGKGENVEIEIGANQFLADLEQGIVGHAAGDTFRVDVNFPENYKAEALRGKTAPFDVVLTEVREAVLPEIDAEFSKQHGVEGEGGVEALRLKCRTALEGERDKAIRARVKQQVLEELLRLHPIDVPESLVGEEITRLRDDTAERMGLANNPDKSLIARKAQLLPDTLFEPNARRRVALGLLISEAVRNRNIQPDETRVELALNGIAADYEQPEQVKSYYRSKPELMQSLRSVAIEDQLIEVLGASAQIEYESMSLEALLNPTPPAKA